MYKKVRWIWINGEAPTEGDIRAPLCAELPYGGGVVHVIKEGTDVGPTTPVEVWGPVELGWAGCTLLGVLHVRSERLMITGEVSDPRDSYAWEMARQLEVARGWHAAGTAMGGRGCVDDIYACYLEIDKLESRVPRSGGPAAEGDDAVVYHRGTTTEYARGRVEVVVPPPDIRFRREDGQVEIIDLGRFVAIKG